MIKQLEELMQQLGDVSPAAFGVFILLGFNLLLRRTPRIPNWSIPWLSVLIGIGGWMAFVPLATNFHNPLARNAGMGFLIGLAASIGYGGIVRFAEKRWPWLHDVLNNGNGKSTDETKSENEKHD